MNPLARLDRRRLDLRRFFKVDSRRLLRLYPRDWRARYGDEFAALIERCPPSPAVLFDILRGALDAHLHRVWRHNMAPIHAEAVTAFTRRFGQLMDEGKLSLAGILDALAGEQQNADLRDAIVRIRQAVYQGHRLSDAMAQYPRLFDPAYIGMVRHGESEGELDIALLRLADSLAGR